MVQNNHENGSGPALHVAEGAVPETHIPTTVQVGDPVRFGWDVGNDSNVVGQARALLAMIPGGNVATGRTTGIPGGAGLGALGAVTLFVEWTVNIAPGVYTAALSLQEVTPGADQNPARLNELHTFSFTVTEVAAAVPHLFAIGSPFIS